MDEQVEIGIIEQTDLFGEEEIFNNQSR